MLDALAQRDGRIDAQNAKIISLHDAVFSSIDPEAVPQGFAQADLDAVQASLLEVDERFALGPVRLADPHVAARQDGRLHEEFVDHAEVLHHQLQGSDDSSGDFRPQSTDVHSESPIGCEP